MQNNPQITISQDKRGYIILDVQGIASIRCEDTSLILHASYDGDHWWDIREETDFLSAPLLRSSQDAMYNLKGACYLRIRRNKEE